jgi:ABC-2 type transport system permease protein
LTLALAHARAATLELARHPAYVVPTLAFPAVFFLFFAGSAPARDANVRMATFAGFAAIGVAFFQFGVGIAVERASPWETYVRTLPVGAGVRLLARLCSAALFAAAASAVVVLVALSTTTVALSFGHWLELAAALLVGTVPFALLGIAIGYWAPPRGALPIANLLYLALSYAGGLWFQPSHLPDAVERASPFLPTRALADALAAPADGTTLPPWRAWCALAGFTVAFGVLALRGYRRDENRRYG